MASLAASLPVLGHLDITKLYNECGKESINFDKEIKFVISSFVATSCK